MEFKAASAAGEGPRGGLITTSIEGKKKQKQRRRATFAPSSLENSHHFSAKLSDWFHGKGKSKRNGNDTEESREPSAGSQQQLQLQRRRSSKSNSSTTHSTTKSGKSVKVPIPARRPYGPEQPRAPEECEGGGGGVWWNNDFMFPYTKPGFAQSEGRDIPGVIVVPQCGHMDCTETMEDEEDEFEEDVGGYRHDPGSKHDQH